MGYDGHELWMYDWIPLKVFGKGFKIMSKIIIGISRSDGARI